MNKEDIEKIGLIEIRPNIFSDREDIEFNTKTKELFYFDCTNGQTTLYRKVKDLEDLKQALIDGFPYASRHLNIE